MSDRKASCSFCGRVIEDYLEWCSVDCMIAARVYREVYGPPPSPKPRG